MTRDAAPGGPGALVIGGDYRGLGIVRSIGRHGVQVWVAQHDDRLAGFSRYAARRVRWSVSSDAEQTERLLRFADEHGLHGWVLFPTDDRVAAMISRNHGVLGQCYRLTTSPWEQYSVAQDKRLTYARADALGIGVPATWYTESLEEVADLDLEYPVILKPASGEIDNPLTQVKAWRVDDRASLLTRYAEAASFLRRGHVMIQEMVPGGGECQLAFAAACRDGDARTFVSARRTRQMPMDFGRSSTFVETIDDPEVIDQGMRLVADLRLTGLVEVEFKRDPRRGRLKVLDVNARSWGWHSLGPPAGADFSYVAWQLAIGEQVERTQGRAGVRWVRLSTDVPTSVREIVAGHTTLRAYLRTLRPPLEGPIWAVDDPLPGLMELPTVGWHAVRRIATRKVRRNIDRGSRRRAV
ncbi:MAG: ATP-grasp domain-containing protein [Acidimicrobiia bacterium]